MRPPLTNDLFLATSEDFRQVRDGAMFLSRHYGRCHTTPLIPAGKLIDRLPIFAGYRIPYRPWTGARGGRKRFSTNGVGASGDSVP